MGALCLGVSSLYKRLGGENGVKIFVRVLYGKVMADERLKLMFAKTDWSLLMDHMSYFLAFAFGGPNSYAEKTQLEAHAAVSDGKYPDEIQWEALVVNINATLKDLCVDPDDIEEILRIVQQIKNDVLGLAQDSEDRKKEKQDDLRVVLHVKSKNGEGWRNSLESGDELSLAVYIWKMKYKLMKKSKLTL